MTRRLVGVFSFLLYALGIVPVSLSADTQACEAQSRKACIATADCTWQATGACASSGEGAMGCAGYTDAKLCNEGRNTSSAKCEWVVSGKCVTR
jgi:hypothetical protein